MAHDPSVSARGSSYQVLARRAKDLCMTGALAYSNASLSLGLLATASCLMQFSRLVLPRPSQGIPSRAGYIAFRPLLSA